MVPGGVPYGVPGGDVIGGDVIGGDVIGGDRCARWCA
jgi:hypothetical protein